MAVQSCASGIDRIELFHNFLQRFVSCRDAPGSGIFRPKEALKRCSLDRQTPWGGFANARAASALRAVGSARCREASFLGGLACVRILSVLSPSPVNTPARSQHFAPNARQYPCAGSGGTKFRSTLPAGRRPAILAQSASSGFLCVKALRRKARRLVRIRRARALVGKMLPGQLQGPAPTGSAAPADLKTPRSTRATLDTSKNRPRSQASAGCRIPDGRACTKPGQRPS